jgi:hypothetical protein
MKRRCKSLAQWAIRHTARVMGSTLPLSVRKALVASAICRTSRAGFELSMGMLDDLRRRSPDDLHRFLWSNHLAYASSYEVSRRFGKSNLNPTRKILFDDMVAHLRTRGFDARKHIRSIFEVGCSMGYLLRHLETEVCPAAEILHGIDIDEYAIRTGMDHLGALQSKVKLFAADMAATGRIMHNEPYDVVLCCGALMYVNEETAEHVVRIMFSRAARLVGIICLAGSANAAGSRGRSVTRSQDGAFIHDVGRMIRGAGGRVVQSTWVGTQISGSSPSHVILAEPQGWPSTQDVRV